MSNEFHKWNVANKRYRLIGTVAFAEKAWNAARESQWIHVDDGLPEDYKEVLVWGDIHTEHPLLAYQQNGEFLPIPAYDYAIEGVQWWHELPELPKE